MKSKILALAAVLFVIFFLAGPVQAQKMGFRFKFTGGYGTMKIGDPNLLMEDTRAYLDDVADAIETWYGIATEVSGDVKKMNMGIEFGGEAILTFGSFGVGLGLESFSRSAETAASLTLPDFSGWNMDYSNKGSVKILALTPSVYGFFGKPPLNFYVYAGAGYYFGKTEADSVFVDDIFYYNYTEEYAADVTGSGIGFHGGLGIEFELAKNFGLFLEGKGRYCKIKNWEGDATFETHDDLGWHFSDESSGKAWIFEYQSFYTGNYFWGTDLDESEPDWSDIKNVRRFEIDLTGFSIRAGFIIKF